MKPVDRLVWVDIETTGLDYAKDQILEIAVVITDRDLNEIDWRTWAIQPRWPIALGPEVCTMHARNGLLAELAEATDLETAEAVAIERIFAAGASGGPICGSTPHFDRRFIERDLPRLATCFSHRCYDVSTLKQAWCLAHGQEWPKGDPAHRALEDIRGSIKIAREILVSRGEVDT